MRHLLQEDNRVLRRLVLRMRLILRLLDINKAREQIPESIFERFDLRRPMHRRNPKYRLTRLEILNIINLRIRIREQLRIRRRLHHILHTDLNQLLVHRTLIHKQINNRLDQIQRIHYILTVPPLRLIQYLRINRINHKINAQLNSLPRMLIFEQQYQPVLGELRRLGPHHLVFFVMAALGPQLADYPEHVAHVLALVVVEVIVKNLVEVRGEFELGVLEDGVVEVDQVGEGDVPLLKGAHAFDLGFVGQALEDGLVDDGHLCEVVLEPDGKGEEDLVELFDAADVFFHLDDVLDDDGVELPVARVEFFLFFGLGGEVLEDDFDDFEVEDEVGAGGLDVFEGEDYDFEEDVEDF